MDAAFFLQVGLASFASMFVGFLWYSEFLFARIWWRHTFPGTQFGALSFQHGNMPLYLTLLATIVQNVFLTFSINAIYPLVSGDCSGIKFPVFFALTVASIVVCVSFPHYVFSRKSFALFLICSGHDVAQTAAAIFTAYFLLPAK